MYETAVYRLCGDSSVSVEFGNEIDEKVFSKVSSFMQTVESQRIIGIKEVVPTYRSLFISYDPMLIDYSALLGILKSTELKMKENRSISPLVIDIPVTYSGEYGPDIENVASHNSISVDEVVKIHTSKIYPVYMLGFTPGFPYLGGIDPRIQAPRLSSPRVKIPAGSVGIAGSQTGIYPIVSPGGWQLIGRTPLKLFDPELDDPFLLKPGMYIKFVTISKEEYISISLQVDKKEFKPKINREELIS